MSEIDWTQVEPGTSVVEPVRGRVLEFRGLAFRKDGTLSHLRCVDPAKRGASHALDPEKARLHEPDADAEDKLHWQRLTPGEYVTRETVRGAQVRVWFEKGRGWALEVKDEDLTWHKSKKAAKQRLDDLRGD